MNAGKAVLAQIMEFASRYEFNKCVDKYNGNHKVKTFTCWEQFIVMSFAQLTYRESLRDIEACLQAISNKLYHCGVKSKVAKSTLADANESRDWRIYADFAQKLINEARRLYKDDNDFKIEIDEIAYALDSSTIDLCLSLFPWAKFRKKKGAVKMHTLLDLRGSIPTFIEITDGKVHDVNILDLLLIEPGAVYIMDRAYVDFARLFDMHQAQAYFVIREKQHFNFKRLYSRKVDKKKGFKCDQTIVLTGYYTSKKYPEKLRRIKYYDDELGKTLIFLTNNFIYSSEIIAQLYKERWKVGVSSEGHITQSVKVRPRIEDPNLVAWEAPWRETKTVKPSDNVFIMENMQHYRPQRTVNVEVASLHEGPVAETVYNVRRQQGLTEKGLIRQFSLAGYQRWHVVKGYVETGEAPDTRRRNIVEEVNPITLNGKWMSRYQGGGIGW